MQLFIKVSITDIGANIALVFVQVQKQQYH